MRRTPGLTFLALLLVAADPSPEPPDPDSDAKKLEGTWGVEKLESKDFATAPSVARTLKRQKK